MYSAHGYHYDIVPRPLDEGITRRQIAASARAGNLPTIVIAGNRRAPLYESFFGAALILIS